MSAERVMGHQLLGDLFREHRVEPASDVDCRQLRALALVICLESRALEFEFRILGVSL